MEEAAGAAPLGPDDHGRRRFLKSTAGPNRPGGAARAAAAEAARQVHPRDLRRREKRHGAWSGLI